MLNEFIFTGLESADYGSTPIEVETVNGFH